MGTTKLGNMRVKQARRFSQLSTVSIITLFLIIPAMWVSLLLYYHYDMKNVMQTMDEDNANSDLSTTDGGCEEVCPTSDTNCTEWKDCAYLHPDVCDKMTYMCTEDGVVSQIETLNLNSQSSDGLGTTALLTFLAMVPVVIGTALVLHILFCFHYLLMENQSEDPKNVLFSMTAKRKDLIAIRKAVRAKPAPIGVQLYFVYPSPKQEEKAKKAEVTNEKPKPEIQMVQEV